MSQSLARRLDASGPAITVFLVLTAVFSLAIWIGMAVSEVFRGVAFVPLMWTPGVAAIVTQRIRGRTIRDLGLGWGLTRYQLLSLALPVLLSAAVYVLVWTTGLGQLSAAGLPSLGAGAEAGSASPLGDIGRTLLVFGTLGLVAGIVLALGEELGWRGLLLPELARSMSFRGAALVSGAIWSVWHLPLILFFGYRGQAPLWYCLIWACAGMMGASVVLAWLRLRSGSVWTAAIFHGAHNIIVQEILDPATADTGITEWVVGEFGFAVPLAWILVATVFWLRGDRWLQQPEE